jgi:hypothetical protein
MKQQKEPVSDLKKFEFFFGLIQLVLALGTAVVLSIAFWVRGLQVSTLRLRL